MVMISICMRGVEWGVERRGNQAGTLPEPPRMGNGFV
jgi:hypothetical protein